MASQQLTGQLNGDVIKRMRQDTGEDDIMATCQKFVILAPDNIQCNGCKLYYCLKCACLSKILYTCLENGEFDDFHSTCSCCKSMFPSLDNIATTLQELHQKSEKRMNTVEEKMNRLETNTKDEIRESISSMKKEILESVKGGIAKLVDARTRELEDRKRRELNLIVFYLPEQACDDGAVNKQAEKWVGLQTQ